MQWVSGASDGSLAVWSQMKKRPVSIIKQAHATPASEPHGGPAAMDSDAASWVQSVAACQGSDLVVSLCPAHGIFGCTNVSRRRIHELVTIAENTLLFTISHADPLRATCLSTVSVYLSVYMDRQRCRLCFYHEHSCLSEVLNACKNI